MTTKTQEIRIQAYDYTLPDDRIARFPLPKRDESKLLLYRNGEISEDLFKHITHSLPPDALIVFNNTKVIQARMLFQKETGAKIELFCLEPAVPHDYALIFEQTQSCVWTCMVGNLKKWKEGTLHKRIEVGEDTVVLTAEKKESFGNSLLIEFRWDNPSLTFAQLLELAGVLPIPPYLHRETEESDLQTYQTVYSKIKGSVAAPTAGLHFTPEVLAELDARGFGREELTLHVGAGTFKPVKSDTIQEHEMHTEFISVNKKTIQRIKDHAGNIIAVGTTSVRTLESLYYIGVLLKQHPTLNFEELNVTQWMAYAERNNSLSVAESLQTIINYLEQKQADTLIASTQIMIAPGYTFKLVKGIVTNFHQPKSTLLLLISAFTKGDWKPIYEYALNHDFRFLSYGDSSLLL